MKADFCHILKRLFFVPGSCSTVFLYLSMVFVVCLLLSNVLAAKLIKVGSFSVSAGILIFPISYIINDVLSEVYGYEKTRSIIYCGFALNVFMVLIFEFAILLPAPMWFEHADAFQIILGSTPRTVLAGLVAYLFGSLVNARVLTRMKSRHDNSFGVRAIVSTIYGETTDSLLFVPIAFLGAMPCNQMLIMIGIQVVVKTFYETICLPVTTIVLNKIKVVENIE